MIKLRKIDKKNMSNDQQRFSNLLKSGKRTLNVDQQKNFHVKINYLHVEINIKIVWNFQST